MSSSDFEWGVKNGDLEKVKEAVEKVRFIIIIKKKFFSFKHSIHENCH